MCSLNTGINPKGVGKNRFILYPEDGIVDFGSESRITGLLRVVFPQDWSNTMLRFIVSIFNYKEGTCADYYISGYPYSVEIGDGAWYECTAISIGRKGKVFSDLPVKFGKTENGETAITIGNINTVWNYPKVYIHDIMVGQNNVEFDKWTQGWGLKICPYEMDTIQTTISHPHITYEEPIIYRRISPESDTFPWGNSVVKSKIKSMHGHIFVKNGVCYAYFSLVLTEGTVGNEIFLQTGLPPVGGEGFYVMGTSYDGNLVLGMIQSYIYINGNGNWFVVAPPNLNIMFSFSYPITG